MGGAGEPLTVSLLGLSTHPIPVLPPPLAPDSMPRKDSVRPTDRPPKEVKTKKKGFFAFVNGRVSKRDEATGWAGEWFGWRIF